MSKHAGNDMRGHPVTTRLPVEYLERYLRNIETLCRDLYRGGTGHAAALKALADIGRSVDIAEAEGN